MSENTDQEIIIVAIPCQKKVLTFHIEVFHIKGRKISVFTKSHLAEKIRTS